jgi:hypothetical protein
MATAVPFDKVMTEVDQWMERHGLVQIESGSIMAVDIFRKWNASYEEEVCVYNVWRLGSW